jgi:hypothetical protein
MNSSVKFLVPSVIDPPELGALLVVLALVLLALVAAAEAAEELELLLLPHAAISPVATNASSATSSLPDARGDAGLRPRRRGAIDIVCPPRSSNDSPRNPIAHRLDGSLRAALLAQR